MNTEQSQRHPVSICMDSVVPRLSSLPVPPQQSKDLAPVFNVHNAIRRSVHCISAYMSTFNAVDSNFVMIRQAAIECRAWINWYMPFLHHHHHLEDEYWFPAYRQVLIDAGVKAKDVNTVFDQWESDHKELDQREQEMRRDLDTLCSLIDVSRAETQESLYACQRSLNAFATFIDSHLKSEEEYWVDQFITNNRITDKKAKQLGETFAKTKLKKMKPKELGYLLAFCMSPLGKQQEQAVLKSFLPFPVRCYYNWFARKSYLADAPRLYLIAHGHTTA